MKKIFAKVRALKTLTKMFFHFDNWQEIWSAYRSKKLLPAFSLRNGVKLEHNAMDDAWSLFKEIFIDRCYTNDNFYTPKAGDKIIDCGANIGFFTCYLKSHAAEANVYCFEPAAKTRERLKKNLDINKFENVKIFPYAIYDAKSQLQLQLPTFAGDAMIANSTKAETESVPTITLDDAIKLCGENGEKIQLLKMDVEGAEVEIFSKANENTFKKIERISIEYHEAYRPGSRDQLLELFRRYYSEVEYFSFPTEQELGIMRAKGFRENRPS